MDVDPIVCRHQRGSEKNLLHGWSHTTTFQGSSTSRGTRGQPRVPCSAYEVLTFQIAERETRSSWLVWLEVASRSGPTIHGLLSSHASSGKDQLLSKDGVGVWVFVPETSATPVWRMKVNWSNWVLAKKKNQRWLDFLLSACLSLSSGSLIGLVSQVMTSCSSTLVIAHSSLLVKALALDTFKMMSNHVI